MWALAIAVVVGMVIAAAIAFIAFLMGAAVAERGQDRLDGRFP